MLGNEDEDRLCRRFFEQFEQFVGRRAVHLLRLPDDHHFVPVTVRFETEFMQDISALFLIDHALLGLHSKGFMPILQIEIAVRQDDLAPRFKESIAGIAGIGFDNREDKMQVRMLQFLELETGRAYAATILVCPVRTIEILRVGQSQLQFAYSGNAGKELGMRYSSLTHRLTQLLLRRLLTYDTLEKQL